MNPRVFNSIEQPGDLFNEIADMYGVDIENNYISYDNSIVKGQGNRIYLEDSITILIGSTYHLKPFNFIIKRDYIKPLVILFYYKVSDGLVFWCESYGEGIELKPSQDVSIKKTTGSNSVWAVPADSTVEMITIYINFDWIITNIDSDKNHFIGNIQKLSREFFGMYKESFIDTNLTRLANSLFEQNKTKITDVSNFNLLIKDFAARYKKIFVSNSETPDHKLLEQLENARIELVKDLSIPAPSLKELCRLTGLNRLTFQTRFKERYGTTFYQYYQDARYAKAKELLLSKQYSVTQVAYAVNCRNLSHFAREFYRRFGTHPSDLLN